MVFKSSVPSGRSILVGSTASGDLSMKICAGGLFALKVLDIALMIDPVPVEDKNTHAVSRVATQCCRRTTVVGRLFGSVKFRESGTFSKPATSRYQFASSDKL